MRLRGAVGSVGGLLLADRLTLVLQGREGGVDRVVVTIGDLGGGLLLGARKGLVLPGLQGRQTASASRLVPEASSSANWDSREEPASSICPAAWASTRRTWSS